MGIMVNVIDSTFSTVENGTLALVANLIQNVPEASSIGDYSNVLLVKLSDPKDTSFELEDDVPVHGSFICYQGRPVLNPRSIPPYLECLVNRALHYSPRKITNLGFGLGVTHRILANLDIDTVSYDHDPDLMNLVLDYFPLERGRVLIKDVLKDPSKTVLELEHSDVCIVDLYTNLSQAHAMDVSLLLKLTKEILCFKSEVVLLNIFPKISIPDITKITVLVGDRILRPSYIELENQFILEFVRPQGVVYA